MTRSLLRLLAAPLLALALVVGFSAASAGAATAQRAPVTTPSAACQGEYDAFTGAVGDYNATAAQVRRDDRRVARKQAKVDRASSRAQQAKARKQLKRAQQAQRRDTARRAGQRERAIGAYTTWQTCEGDATTPTPTSPIQALCDSGVPQPVCDAFTQLPVPAPGTTGDSPIQALCDAGVPQALCDAATLPGTGDASPLQPLCDLGLPQAICDASAGGGAGGGGGGLPLPIPTDPICGLIPLPGLCP